MTIQRARSMAIAVAAAALGLTAPALGQARHPRSVGVWASVAAGPTSPYEFGIIATGAIRYHRLVIRGRYASAAEFLGDWDEDLGVLVGIALPSESRRALVTVSAGVGRVTGGRGCILCGTQSLEPLTAFLFDAEGRFALTGFMGVTGYFFGNYNSREPFAGLAIGLFVGRL